MLYILDGYNVIGKCHSVSLTEEGKEEKLINLIKRRGPGEKDKLTIVFDGKGFHSQFGHREVAPPYTVYFTASDQTADDVIIDMVKDLKNTTGVIVVSSDRMVMKAAKKYGVKVIKSEQFLKTYGNRKTAIDTDQKKDRPVQGKDVEYWLDQFSQ